MPKKQKSLYVNEKDKPMWAEAARLIAFHEGKSLSAYLTEHLRKYVEKHTAPKSRKQ